MAQLITNTFTAWELTEEEEHQGAMFTITQIQALQNQLAMCAEEKLALEFDPLHPELYAQAEAFKRGQISILQYLIDTSHALQSQPED